MEIKFLSDIQSVNIYDTLSIILSLIAIFVSIYAISSQNKGVVFEHRLSIYCKVSDMYERCSRIIKLCTGKDIKLQKEIISAILFKFDSEEYKIATKVINDSSRESTNIMDRYAELYISKEDIFFHHESKIFYEKLIYDNIQLLANKYDTMILSYLLYDKNEMNEFIENLNVIIKKYDEEKILEKMKNKLPI